MYTQVLGFLSDLFMQFDELSVQHGVHKLKTIGDAYVVCAGAFDDRPVHFGGAATHVAYVAYVKLQ